MALFWLLALISVLAARQNGLGFYNWLKIVEFGFFFLYVKFNFQSLFNWIRFWQFFIAGALLQSLIALAQFFKQASLGLRFLTESPLSPDLAGVAKIVVDNQKIIRAYGTTPHPNILAAVLLVAIFGVCFLFLKQAKPGIVLRLVLILLIVALFFTFSRTAMAVGLFFGALWLITEWRRGHYRPQIRQFSLVVTVVLVCLVIFGWSFLVARYAPENINGGQAVDLRIFLNQVAVKFIGQHPLLGVGPGNFVAVMKETIKLDDWLYQPVHNIYLLAAAELGLPALLAFLVFLFLTVKNAGRSQEKPAVIDLLLLFLGFLVWGFFDHFFWDLQQGRLLFWIILGLLASLGYRSFSHKSENQNF